MNRLAPRVIEASNLRRTFGTAASRRVGIDGVDLEIAKGEFVTLFGPSGSGKTTLLGIVGGLDRGFEGEVKLRGRSLRSMSDKELSRLRGEQLGFVFQAFHLLDHLTALENVLIPSRFTHQRHPKRRAKEALERVGLADRAKDMTGNLSGGQRQRVAIARGIAHKPALLLCDEPTGNLDEETAGQVIDLFVSLNVDKTTVLCATHDERLSRVATRMVRLRDGRLETGRGNEGSGRANE